MSAAAPSGVVTFLFTDVEGSTRRWEADAVVMRSALAAHDEVLRSVIETHGGWLFKHTGDGVCAAFNSPASAIDAAVAAQHALELPVRMGVATGEAELRDGDYFGPVLNRVARLMAAGHGGQILVADSTAGLLSGVDLLELGPRRLRDVPIPVGLFQVRAEGLRTEFPSLRALDTSRGNLRPATTSLIGRESEVGEIGAAVRAHRLVTLTGVGGVGKTRLAFEVATRLAGEFPDGVWVFELAAVTDPAAVPDAVASVLGITQQPGKTVSESVAAGLDGRIRLLVFDNCEHVVDSVANLVEAILAASATVTILGTSREGLGVAEERLWRVPSLGVDSGNASAAVSLFVERAKSVESDFSLAHPGEAEAVVEVCRKLDGIPLAIELAASRMGSMTAREVRDRIDQRFALLVGSRRGLERHQTLRHAVAWSYDLLDDAEKSLLTGCSVFTGGFDLESAVAVAGFEASGEFAVLILLDALVRKSLLIADRSAVRTRFSMLETIRQFAEEQLVARGEAATVRSAHACHFAQREADLMALWDTPRQREVHDWLATELANLRTAFRWATDHDDLDDAAAIASYAGFVGLITEKYEPFGWAEELIEPARAADHPRLAEVYTVAAQCFLTGRLDDGVRYTDAARMVLAERSDVLPSPFDVMIGGAYTYIGHPEECVEWCRAQLRHCPDSVPMRAYLVVTLVAASSGEQATAATSGLIEAAEATANPFILSFALLACSYAFREVDPARAVDAARRGLVVAHDSASRYFETQLAIILGGLEAEDGDIASAFDHLSLAIGHMHDSGETSNTPLAALAALFGRLGRHEVAATVAGFALSPLTAVGTPEINTAITRLRQVLGDQTYESLARRGEMMTTAEMVTYAYDQIDRARAELSAVSE